MRTTTWVAVVCALLVPIRVRAAERLCDTRYQNCRAPLMTLIANERQGIDVAFWFMQDQRYVTALIQRHQAGVPVRVLVDPRASLTKPGNQKMLDQLRAAGIPMRMKAALTASDILHWKMMLFAGQDVVQFGAANYTEYFFVPVIPYADYIDEAVFFTDHPSLTNSFRRKFEDLWTDTTGNVVDYANISSPPQRVYGLFPKDPSLNFPPREDYAVRAVARYGLETAGIDVIMFRVADARHADAMINAKARGVRVRLIIEQQSYRDRKFLWHAYNVDRLIAAGIPVKQRKHDGLTHQKSVVLRGLREVIFGSSNWSPTAANVEQDHNLFTSTTCQSGRWCDVGGWVFQWFAKQFDSKWAATAEFEPFVALPPDAPVYVGPANGATGVSTAPALRWQGGSWAHLYDVYLGTDPNNLPLVVRNARIGSPDPNQLEVFRPATLAGSTTYYWRVVSRTMAKLSRSGQTWRFTTGPRVP